MNSAAHSQAAPSKAANRQHEALSTRLFARYHRHESTGRSLGSAAG